VLLDPSVFVWRALAMLPGLINEGSRQQFRRIKFADCKALGPCLLTASEAAKLCAPDVPQLDIDTVRAALAEEHDGHQPSLTAQRTKSKTSINHAQIPPITRCS
jgi:hypothetical protein